MTTVEAKERVDEQWHAIAEKGLHHPVQIDDALTDEYPWGWVFYFVEADAYSTLRKAAFAIDRVTGESFPVGTKGLEHAVHILMSWRSQLGVSEVNR